jgi:hypothetical protein
MRKTYLPSLVVLGLLLAGMALSAVPARAQDLGPNLLENPGFEGGHYNQDGIAEITVPNGWRMHWSNNELIFGGEWPTARPETVVWNASGGIPAGEEIYWKDGIYTMKIFKSWAPMWAAMSQDVENLEVGRTYRMSVPIFIDIFEEFKDGKKVAPWRKDTGKIRFGASPVGAAWRDENAINYSGWWTAETIDPFYLAMPTFVWDFVATQPNMTIWIEMVSSYPYPNNGFFFDLPGLYATSTTSAVAQPAAPAAPAAQGQQPAAPAAPVAAAAQPVATVAPREDGSIVHVVQAGESMWVIAIRYAQTLGMSPEEALPYIQELNNNPTFLNPGDEILIQAATAEAPEPTAETPAEGTPAAEGTAAEGDAEATPSEGDAAPVEGAATEGETAATGDAAVEATPEAAFQPVEALAGTICVAAFQDANADGQRNEGEALVADAAIAIARAGSTVSTYITDGASEPFCFELTQADSYQLQLYPPAGYSATTEDNWAVSIANGESYTVSFGLTDAPAVSDAARTETVDTAAGDTAAAPDATAEADTGGLPGNLGLIVLGVAAVLVVLAVVGVVLLRRG